MAPLKIQIDGHGEFSRQPELALVTFHIESKGDDQASIVNRVQEATAAVQAHILPLSTTSTPSTSPPTPIARWSSGGMSTVRYDEYSYDEMTGQARRAKQVFQASVDIQVTFRDFRILSTTTRDLGANPLVTVSRVEWTLTPETQKSLRGVVVKRAFDDAQEKASAYALAAGRTVATAVEIRDGVPDVRVPFNEGRAMAFGGGGPGAGAGGEQLTLEYVPEDVKYTTDCTVTFNAE